MSCAPAPPTSPGASTDSESRRPTTGTPSAQVRLDGGQDERCCAYWEPTDVARLGTKGDPKVIPKTPATQQSGMAPPSRRSQQSLRAETISILALMANRGMLL